MGIFKIYSGQNVSLALCSRPDRLRDIADRFNLDQNAVLDNVLYARAYTSKYSISLQEASFQTTAISGFQVGYHMSRDMTKPTK